ncbi:hypothetical protein H4I96_08612 [Botrytis cinerea]
MRRRREGGGGAGAGAGGWGEVEEEISRERKRRVEDVWRGVEVGEWSEESGEITENVEKGKKQAILDHEKLSRKKESVREKEKEKERKGAALDFLLNMQVRTNGASFQMGTT